MHKKCEEILKKLESQGKIKVWWGFKFPEPFDNGIRLKDLLETEVDEKFYISEDKVSRFISELNDKNALLYDVCQMKREGKAREYNDYSPTLTSRDYKDPRIVNVEVIGKLNSSQDGVVISPNGIAPTHTAEHGNCPKIVEENKVRQIGNIRDSGNWDNPQTGRVYDPDGCSPTFSTMQGGDRTPKILQKGRGFNKGGVHDVSPTISSNSWQCNNFLIEDPKVLCPKRQYDDKGNRSVKHSVSEIVPTILAAQYKAGDNQCKIYHNFRIRKLTPLECFRLMGFDDEAFEKSKLAGISNSQLYKIAGNSIVIDVLFHIYMAIYKESPYLFDDLKVGSFFSGCGAFEMALNRFFEYMQTNSSQQSEVTENFTQPPMPLSSLAV